MRCCHRGFRVRLVVLGFLLGAYVGCNRTPAEPDSPSHPSSQSQSAEQSTSHSDDGSRPQTAKKPGAKREEPAAPTVVEFRFPAAARVVAIGDLHGDLSATLRAFRLAGAVDERGAWIGGDLVVVQTGDQLDRGDQEAGIFEFLSRIQKAAKASGGAVHVLSGNHETMNVLGDFRYVTPAGLHAFSGWKPSSPLSLEVPEPYRPRAEVFLPGGAGALRLSQQPLVIIVGSTVFAHGGVLPAHARYGIDRLNRETAEWMRGKTTIPPQLVVSSDGPVWTRLYGSERLDKGACDTLRQTLALLSVERLVVGHTVQDKGMSSGCDGAVYRIDVGLAAYYGDRPVQVLEITDKGARVLSEG